MHVSHKLKLGRKVHLYLIPMTGPLQVLQTTFGCSISMCAGFLEKSARDVIFSIVSDNCVELVGVHNHAWMLGWKLQTHNHGVLRRRKYETCVKNEEAISEDFESFKN